MGYPVELVETPPRLIACDDLAQAPQGLGWQVSQANQDTVLMNGGQMLTRLNFDKGKVWVKSPDDAAAHAAALLPSPDVLRRKAQKRAWDVFGIVMLFGVSQPMFAFKVNMDFR